MIRSPSHSSGLERFCLYGTPRLTIVGTQYLCVTACPLFATAPCSCHILQHTAVRRLGGNFEQHKTTFQYNGIHLAVDSTNEENLAFFLEPDPPADLRKAEQTNNLCRLVLEVGGLKLQLTARHMQH